jgi:cytochrome c oxidase subunit 3
LHVLGGVVALCVVYLRATRLSVVADIINPLRAISVYWHGLAVLWLMMFSVLLLTR